MGSVSLTGHSRSALTIASSCSSENWVTGLYLLQGSTVYSCPGIQQACALEQLPGCRAVWQIFSPWALLPFAEAQSAVFASCVWAGLPDWARPARHGSWHLFFDEDISTPASCTCASARRQPWAPSEGGSTGWHRWGRSAWQCSGAQTSAFPLQAPVSAPHSLLGLCHHAREGSIPTGTHWEPSSHPSLAWAAAQLLWDTTELSGPSKAVIHQESSPGCTRGSEPGSQEECLRFQCHCWLHHSSQSSNSAEKEIVTALPVPGRNISQSWGCFFWHFTLWFFLPNAMGTGFFKDPLQN